MRSVFIAILALATVAAAIIFTVSALVPVDPANKDGRINLLTTTKENDNIGSRSEKNNQDTFYNDGASLEGTDTVSTLSKIKSGWGLGPSKNELGQPFDALNAQQRYEELGGYFIFPQDENVLYLTFDLGYENGYTPIILDILKSKGIKGTFFITMDYISDAPDVVQRIIDEGHTLANHTVTHPSMPTISEDRVKNEISELHSYVLDNFGYRMTLFRYPMGEYSEYTLDIINNMGYKSIFWSFAYKDWLTNAQPDKASSLKKITDALHPGAIYLLHAVSSTNAAILGDFIDAAEAKGYSFRLIDERLGISDTPEIPAPGILG